MAYHPVAVYTAPSFLPVEFQRLLNDALGGSIEPGGGLPLTGGTLTGPLTIDYAGDGLKTTRSDTGEVAIVNPAHFFQSRPTQSPQGMFLFIGADGNWWARDVATATQLPITDIVNGQLAGIAALNDTIAALEARVAALEGAAP